MIAAAIASTAGQAHEGNELWATVVQVSLVLLWPALSIWFLRRHDDPGEPGGDGGSGDGGGPPKPPEPDGPAWWPEFEREFAAYVAAVSTLDQPSPERVI